MGPILLALVATATATAVHASHASQGSNDSSNSNSGTAGDHYVNPSSSYLSIPVQNRPFLPSTPSNSNHLAHSTSPSASTRAPSLGGVGQPGQSYAELPPTVLTMDMIPPGDIVYNVHVSNTVSMTEHVEFKRQWTAFLDRLCPPKDRTPYPPDWLSPGTPVTVPPVNQNQCPSCAEMGMAWRVKSILPPMNQFEREAWMRKQHRNIIFLVELENDIAGKPFSRDYWSVTMEDKREVPAEEDGRRIRGVSKVFNSPDPFMREIMASRELNHALLPTAYCHGTYFGHHQIVYNYVDGSNSAQYLYNLAFDAQGSERYNAVMAKALVSAVSHTLSALFYLHSLGYVHGDIKEDNIIIDHQGVPHIIDLDLTRKVSLIATYGTRGYVCPEMKGWVKGRVGKSADFWSFGIVILRWSLSISAGAMDRRQSDKEKRSVRTHFNLMRKWWPLLNSGDEPIVSDQLPLEIGEETKKMVWPLLTLNPRDRNFDTVESQQWLLQQSAMLANIDFDALNTKYTNKASPCSLQLKRLTEVPLIIQYLGRHSSSASQASQASQAPPNPRRPSYGVNLPPKPTPSAGCAGGAGAGGTGGSTLNTPNTPNITSQMCHDALKVLSRPDGAADSSLHTQGYYAARLSNVRLSATAAHLNHPVPADLPIGCPDADAIPTPARSYPFRDVSVEQLKAQRANSKVDAAILLAQQQARAGNPPEGGLFPIDMPKQ